MTGFADGYERKTAQVMLEGHSIGTTVIIVGRDGVPGATIDEDGAVLVPAILQLTGQVKTK